MLKVWQIQLCLLPDGGGACMCYFYSFAVFDLVSSYRAWKGWKGLAPADARVLLLRCLRRSGSPQRLWSSPGSTAMSKKCGSPRSVRGSKASHALNPVCFTSALVARQATSLYAEGDFEGWGSTKSWEHTGFTVKIKGGCLDLVWGVFCSVLWGSVVPLRPGSSWWGQRMRGGSEAGPGGSP